ncbi:hypothetical protein B9M33_002774 [Salmonella enterica subsp. enterica serovar Denver]|nr:hypothetical protein [Salmonella enterica]EEJ6373178.1 hypothetical protein [Salmonella enterica subsp. enterica serovar Denver]
MKHLSGLPLSRRPERLIRPTGIVSAIRQILVLPLAAISSSSSLFRYNYQQFE